MKKSYTLTLFDTAGHVSSQAVLLDDDELAVLQRGIRVAQGVDWSKTDWTRDEAINEYAEHLSGEGRQQLFEDAIETISDLELFEFMVYITDDPDHEDDEDITDRLRHAEENKAIAENRKAVAHLEEERAKGKANAPENA